MIVKCRLFGQIESDFPVNSLIALTRQFGKESLNELPTDNFIDPNNITISKYEALVLVGGRQSIVQILQQAGDNLLIKGGPPFMIGFARKHHMFGKNETCVKIVSGRTKLPEDGFKYENLAHFIQSVLWTHAVARGGTVDSHVSVKPSDLAGALQMMFD